MKKQHHKRALAGALALSLLALTGCSAQQSSEPGMSIYVICKSQDEYWDTTKAGALDAGEEMGLDVTYEAPASEDMIDEQIRMIDDAITNGAKAIVVAPLDMDMLNDVLDRATQSDVPVLTIDSDVNYEGRKSCISTQNYSAGAIAARYTAKLIDETGEVAVISHSETAQTALERAGGFEDEMAGTSKQSEMPGMIIPDAQMPVSGIPGNQPDTTPAGNPESTPPAEGNPGGMPGEGNPAGDSDANPPAGDSNANPEGNPPAPGMSETQSAPATEAPAASDDGMIPNDQFGYPDIKVVETKVADGDVEQSRMAAVQLIKEHPNLKAIYATNQPGTIGACQAIDELGVGNKVQLIGFDYFEGADNYLSSGVLDAVIAQNPYNMGYLGVRYAKKLVTGEEVASTVDTGATLITPDNMNDEDIRFLVNPTGK